MNNELNNIFTTQNIIIYLIIINIIGFIAMWLDKKKAKKGKWRISETSLLSIGVLGGCIGCLIGMYTFRHKTKKKRFTIGYPIIIIIQIVLIILFNK